MKNAADLKELLEIVVKEQASDLHVSVGHPPILRITGRLVPLAKREKMTPKDTQGLAEALMSPEQFQKFLIEKEIDFSYAFGPEARFRVNAFFQEGKISLALRLISQNIKTIEELNLPPIVKEFTKASQGFVLVVGP